MEEGSTSQNGENPDHFIFPVGDFWVGKDGKWRVLRNGSLSLIPNINHSSISDSQRAAPTHSRPEEYLVCMNPEEDSVYLNPEEDRVYMNTQSIKKTFNRAPGSSRTTTHSILNSVSDWAGPSYNPSIHAPQTSGSWPNFWDSAFNPANGIRVADDCLMTTTRRQCSVSDTQNHGQDRFHGFLKCEDKYADGGSAPKNLAGSSSSDSRINTLKLHSSTSNSIRDEIQLVNGSESKEQICSRLIDEFRDRNYINFAKLLDEDVHFDEAIQEILSESQPFMNAVFSPDGSKAVVKMIKKMAHSDLASTATEILATRLYDIMIDDNASLVIKQCLDSFGDEANEILYKQVMELWSSLVNNEVGSISMKDFIDKISGYRRTDLLKLIADSSDILSNDRYGNHVMQHVVGLEDDTVTTEILCVLKSKFASLSKGKHGCHVVQKLIVSSEYSANIVVLELLQNHYLLARLACHRRGTYVIQKALDKSTKHVRADLVNALKDYAPQLNRYTGGLCVLNKL